MPVSSKLIIREHRPADVPQIARLYYETIRTVNAADYTAEQIAAWAPRIYEPDFWLARWGEDCTVLVADEAGVVGFAELRHHGEIDCFYVHHRHQRRGVGARLMRRIEAEARRRGLARLFADVSITAKPFFLAHGFTVVRQQVKEHRGQLFEQSFMQRHLDE